VTEECTYSINNKKLSTYYLRYHVAKLFEHPSYVQTHTYLPTQTDTWHAPAAVWSSNGIFSWHQTYKRQRLTATFSDEHSTGNALSHVCVTSSATTAALSDRTSALDENTTQINLINLLCVLLFWLTGVVFSNIFNEWMNEYDLSDAITKLLQGHWTKLSSKMALSVGEEMT